MNRFSAVALGLLAVVPSEAWAKQSNTINVPEGREMFASIGDVLLKVTLRESLPNAFGGADIFGRKRDRGFVELRFMGMTQDGRAIIRRRTVDIYSNATTMSGMRFGSATIQPSGDGAVLSGFSTGGQGATVQMLPPDTIEFALDLSKSRIVTVEDRQVEMRSADATGAHFVVSKRAQ